MYKAASLLFCYLAVVFGILKVVTAKHMSSLSFRYKYFIFLAIVQLVLSYNINS